MLSHASHFWLEPAIQDGTRRSTTTKNPNEQRLSASCGVGSSCCCSRATTGQKLQLEAGLYACVAETQAKLTKAGLPDLKRFLNISSRRVDTHKRSAFQ